MTWDENRTARAGLTAVCESASPQLANLLRAYSPAEIWQGVLSRREGAWGARAARLDLDALLSQSDELGIRFLAPGDAEWPDSLSDLDHVELNGMGGQPVGLWALGPADLARTSRRSVAIVGSRASSSYGDHVALELAAELAAGEDGWAIVSGGAYGIDAAAHRGALAAHGRTVAILAGGLDAAYPRGNARLFELILNGNLLVSEVPVGHPPSRAAFLARNRLIAALGQGTIIVEGAARSGAHNTIAWACECGRPAMAVPGPVTSGMSVTPHRLIRDHKASLVTDADDVRAIVEPLSRAPELPLGGGERRLDRLSVATRTVREAMPGRGSVDVGTLAVLSGLPLPGVLASLAELEELVLVESVGADSWRLVRPASR
ncbi:MAG TPA: DNA-processing protein DprA [Propionibacteriaceae bacterium]|nr:DNA-processing protein DprA [Propionibacteriaceae bacterium]